MKACDAILLLTLNCQEVVWLMSQNCNIYFKRDKKLKKESYRVYCWLRIIVWGRAVSSPVQFHAVDKLMALTFLFFIFSPSERKDYTLFDVNELCQRLVYRLRGQLLRRAAGLFFFFFHIYSQRSVNTINIYRCRSAVFSLHLSSLFIPLFPPLALKGSRVRTHLFLGALFFF